MITREKLDAIARELYPEQADWDALTAAARQRKPINARSRICDCGGNWRCRCGTPPDERAVADG